MMEDTSQAPAQETAPATALAAGVQFEKAGKVYTFSTEDATLARGDEVMVEVEGGVALAEIATAPHPPSGGKLPADVRHILRRATPDDVAAAAEFCERALECFAVCRDRIHWRGLPMKLVDAELTEGGRKVVFTFFAEQRVDFRALVKELAATLRLRIEMRQVGSRDESKCIGCMGPCGLTTCCSTHLRQFQSISISMAKHQGLAPNPAKLTGMCGKLKCCLAYEVAAYDECRHGLPKVGAAVETPEGAGKVSGHNVLKRECQVRLYGGGEVRCPCEQCRVLSNEEREKAITAVREAAEQAEERFRNRRQGRADRRPGGRTERPPERPAVGREERPASGGGERPAEARAESPASPEGAKPAEGAKEQQPAGGAQPAGERKEGRHGRRRHRRGRRR